MSEAMVVDLDVQKGWGNGEWGSNVRVKSERSREGLPELAKRLRTMTVKVVVMEASGGYEKKVVRRLQRAHLVCAVVDARRIRAFAQANGNSAKTDVIDAGVVRAFGEHMKYRVAATWDSQLAHL